MVMQAKSDVEICTSQLEHARAQLEKHEQAETLLKCTEDNLLLQGAQSPVPGFNVNCLPVTQRATDEDCKFPLYGDTMFGAVWDSGENTDMFPENWMPEVSVTVSGTKTFDANAASENAVFDMPSVGIVLDAIPHEIDLSDRHTQEIKKQRVNTESLIGSENPAA